MQLHLRRERPRFLVYEACRKTAGPTPPKAMARVGEPSPSLGPGDAKSSRDGFAPPGATRIQNSLLANVERSVLHWMASHLPLWIGPDHLTLLGFLALLGTSICYALSSTSSLFLHAASLGLVLNWLGDSLDGTVARFRHQTRPRYGYYVDHMTDSLGALSLVAGLAFSGRLSFGVAAGVLVGFYLLSIDSYLATSSLGVFRISHYRVSPTELRLALIIGNIALVHHPVVTVFQARVPLFDVGGLVAVAVMVVILVSSVLRTTRVLYRLERVQRPAGSAFRSEPGDSSKP
ncbi:MAG: CDP-alcohol phosphatidyltransferase family protein [Acidobacteriota bacterium]